jgi:hypothetical protein
MGACKSFRPFVENSEQIERWLEILAAELFSRLLDEYELRKRWPKTITVT